MKWPDLSDEITPRISVITHHTHAHYTHCFKTFLILFSPTLQLSSYFPLSHLLIFVIPIVIFNTLITLLLSHSSHHYIFSAFFTIFMLHITFFTSFHGMTLACCLALCHLSKIKRYYMIEKRS